MRIAWLPYLHTCKELTGMSTVNMPMHVFRRWSEEKLPYYVYAMIPRLGEFYEYKAKFFDGINGEIVPISGVKHTMEGEYVFPEEFLDMAQGRSKFAFDIVWNGRNMVSHYLKRCLETGPPGARIDIPIVNMTASPPGKSRDKYFIYNDWLERIMAVNALNDYTLFASPNDRKEFLVRCKRHLSPWVVRELEKKTKAIFAVDFEDIIKRREEFVKIRKKRIAEGKCNLYFAGALASFKRVGEIVNFWESIKPMDNVSLVMKTQKMRDLNGFAERGVSLELGVDRQRMIDKFGDGDIQMCFSEVEGSGTTFFEVACSDMPTIFLREEWIWDWIPTDYRFVANSMVECSAFVKWIRNNYDEAVKEVGRLREFVYKKMSANSVSGEIYDFFEKCIDSCTGEYFFDKFKGTNSFVKLVKGAVNGKEKVSLDEVLEGMQRLSIAKLNFHERTDVITKTWIRRAVLECGFRDTCKKEIGFERKEEKV